MISIQGGHFVPIPFEQDDRPGNRTARASGWSTSLDALRDRAALHDSPQARRLRPIRHEIAKLAATCAISADEFRRQFEYLLDFRAAAPTPATRRVSVRATKRPARAPAADQHHRRDRGIPDRRRSENACKSPPASRR